MDHHYWTTLLVISWCLPVFAAQPDYAQHLAPLIDPANLELMPLKANEEESDKVGARQFSLAKKLNQAGILSDQGLMAVEAARRRR